MLKIIAHRLMLVAASIMVLAGVPGVQINESAISIGQNAYADREEEGFHGPYTDGEGNETNECWSQAPPLSDLIDHHILHCNWLQMAGLIVALCAVLVGLAAFIVSSQGIGSALLQFLLSLGTIYLSAIGIAFSILGLWCSMSWRSYKLDCNYGHIPSDPPLLVS